MLINFVNLLTIKIFFIWSVTIFLNVTCISGWESCSVSGVRDQAACCVHVASGYYIQQLKLAENLAKFFERMIMNFLSCLTECVEWVERRSWGLLEEIVSSYIGKWVSTSECLTIILRMLLFTMSLLVFNIESGYNKLVYDCMPAWHLKHRWLFSSVSHWKTRPIAGFLDLLARTLTISASAPTQNWMQPVCCAGWSHLRFSIVFWIRKKRVHAECGCNAHWQSSRQRKNWMSCENEQVPRCKSALGTVNVSAVTRNPHKAWL